MRRILINEFISWRRKWARIVPRSDAAELAGHRVAPDHAEGLADRATLAAEIVRLPRRQRAVIVLRYYEDLPDEQDREPSRLLGEHRAGACNARAAHPPRS
jgi:DNA-directed RNA polymerase specialized sigma24 family protein